MTTHKAKLNNNQIHLLKIIYKFRFVTGDLVAQYKGVSKRAVNDAFSILLKQGYIARRYNKSFKLLGRAAQYFLAPRAIKLLRNEHELDSTVLHARYKDKSTGIAFVEHNLTTMKACLLIRQAHSGVFTIFTKSELAGYDYFAEPLPDLYMNREGKADGKPSEFLVDICVGTPAFLAQKRVDQYIKHFEEDGWVGEDYPIVTLVCSDTRVVEKMESYTQSRLEDNYIDHSDLKIQVCILGQLVETIALA